VSDAGKIEYPEITDPKERAVFGLDPLPAEEPTREQPTKRPRGRPRGVAPGFSPAPVPTTYEEALMGCRPAEQAFTKAVVGGASYRQAFSNANPSASHKAALNGGQRTAIRPAVKLAIELGRREAARAVVAATKHDVQASFTELGEIMDEARHNKQFTAAVKSAEVRAKLTGALIERSESRQVGGFVFRIEGLPEKGRTIEVASEPVNPAEPKEQDEGADE
jgi:hypothetical protein